MVICTNQTLKVGTIVRASDRPNTLSDAHRVDHPNVSFFVLREATETEYLEYLDEAVGTRTGYVSPCKNFYRISID